MKYAKFLVLILVLFSAQIAFAQLLEVSDIYFEPAGLYTGESGKMFVEVRYSAEGVAPQYSGDVFAESGEPSEITVEPHHATGAITEGQVKVIEFDIAISDTAEPGLYLINIWLERGGIEIQETSTYVSVEKKVETSNIPDLHLGLVAVVGIFAAGILLRKKK